MLVELTIYRRRSSLFAFDKQFSVALTLFRPGFFRPSGPGGWESTKFAQDSVCAKSNHYRYCDVTVT